MKLTEEEIEKLSNPKILTILEQVMSDPKRAIESLDLLIRSPSTPQDSRQRYRDLRTSIEELVLDEN